MGLDLAAFGAGFMGKLSQDRDKQKEEESLIKRQKLLNQLDIDKNEAIAKMKTTAGDVEKVGNSYVVQDRDGNGNPKGTPRPATQSEIREYNTSTRSEETGILDLEGKRFDSSNRQADRDMLVSKYKLDTRATEASIRSSNASTNASNRQGKDTSSKEFAALRDEQLDAEYVINQLPSGAKEKQDYKQHMEMAARSKAPAFKFRQIMNIYKAKAQAIITASKTKESSSAPIDLKDYQK